ncbi:ribonuclease III domain-containing protein [Methanoregula sp.]|uniref:ribonuclease III domain-containing protein n=1 Tax=Methanoregula sp. TaxID=2052170 RepID=UPI002B83B432|nr:ribonuclease III domain-containing protein [Methanoregula sp.]HVP96938.1 ribonuclease III domain-containing protein [Methanoregula sp.]
MPAPLNDLQSRIGYTFADASLLEAAMTRQAYLNENAGAGKDSMDALATVGDAVLGALVVSRLYESGTRDKGTLTTEKIHGVNRDKTRAFAEKFRLETYIRWGKGEEKNRVWLQGSQAFDTAFEALVGAIFLDTRRSGRDALAATGQVLDGLGFF